MTRETADGVWTSDDEGVTWVLTEPSAAWLASRQFAEPAPPLPEDPIE